MACNGNCRSNRCERRRDGFEIGQARGWWTLGDLVRTLPRYAPRRGWPRTIREGSNRQDGCRRQRSLRFATRWTGIPTLLVFQGRSVVEQIGATVPKEAMREALQASFA